MSSQTLTTDDTPPHLTTRRSAITNSPFAESDLSEREYWCRSCCARVTRTPTLDATEAMFETGEYGHNPACEHSIRKREAHALAWRGDE